jgi:hypothetical protein
MSQKSTKMRPDEDCTVLLSTPMVVAEEMTLMSETHTHFRDNNDGGVKENGFRDDVIRGPTNGRS